MKASTARTEIATTVHRRSPRPFSLDVCDPLEGVSKSITSSAEVGLQTLKHQGSCVDKQNLGDNLVVQAATWVLAERPANCGTRGSSPRSGRNGGSPRCSTFGRSCDHGSTGTVPPRSRSQ